MTKIRMDEFGDITTLLEKVKEEICDHYCKYPEQYSFDGKTFQDGERFEQMLEERCEGCPLDLL